VSGVRNTVTGNSPIARHSVTVTEIMGSETMTAAAYGVTMERVREGPPPPPPPCPMQSAQTATLVARMPIVFFFMTHSPVRGEQCSQVHSTVFNYCIRREFLPHCRIRYIIFENVAPQQGPLLRTHGMASDVTTTRLDHPDGIHRSRCCRLRDLQQMGRRGTVGANGVIRVTVASAGRSASGSGRLSANSGAGRWASSRGECSGSWSASRRAGYY
jgi:hypothetical protein